MLGNHSDIMSMIQLSMIDYDCIYMFSVICSCFYLKISASKHCIDLHEVYPLRSGNASWKDASSESDGKAMQQVRVGHHQKPETQR